MYVAKLRFKQKRRWAKLEKRRQPKNIYLKSVKTCSLIVNV